MQNCPRSYVQGEKLHSLVFFETILPLVNNNDTANWERGTVSSSEQASLVFQLFLRSLMWELVGEDISAEDDCQISKWDSLHWMVQSPAAALQQGAWLMLQMFLLGAVAISYGSNLCCCQLPLLRYQSFPLGLGSVTSRLKLYNFLHHQIPKSYMNHSPVVQTNHVDLLCVANWQCMASQDLSAWVGAGSLHALLARTPAWLDISHLFSRSHVTTWAWRWAVLPASQI